MERILTLSHKSGDYVAVNVSGAARSKAEISRTLSRAETYLSRPSTTKNVALQLTDAVLDTEDYAEILKWIRGVQSNLFRLAIVGATHRQQRPLKKGMRQLQVTFNSRYFKDWEAAKDWLVGAIR